MRIRIGERADQLFFGFLIIFSILIITRINEFGASWDEPPAYEFASVLPGIYMKAAQGILFNNFQ